jgi:hypothetical protein
MRKLQVTFRWDHFATNRAAFQTSRWFAAWAKQNDEYLGSRATDIFIEVSVADGSDYRNFIDDLHDRRMREGPLPIVAPFPMQGLFARGVDPETIIGAEPT